MNTKPDRIAKTKCFDTPVYMLVSSSEVICIAVLLLILWDDVIYQEGLNILEAQVAILSSLVLERFRFGFQYLYRYLNLSFSQSDVPDVCD